MEENTKINIPEMKLVGFFSCRACPVQVEGSIANLPFYFRARWDTWTFAVAFDKDGDAVDIQSSSQGFFREGNYGRGECDAGYMPLNEARQIVAKCAEEYWRENPSQS